MPVGFNSPARNLFLLGSTGAQAVSNFFRTIDRAAGTDVVYEPSGIRYNVPDQKYILSGSASDSQSKDFGWFEKRTESGTADWQVKIQSTLATADTTLKAVEIDNNDNLIVVGKTGTVPWVAKYTTGGSISWQSTTNTADLEYTGIAIDINNNIYACGNTLSSGSLSRAFVEKFDSFGNPGWGKSAFMLGRDVVLNKCAVNSRGEVVAVGDIEDDSTFKGYVVKIDANTGEVLWDRTIRTYQPDVNFGYKPVLCEDVYIDGNDQIYVVGRIFGISETRSFIIKYSPEGNMLWQKETPLGNTIEHYYVRSDTETEQTIVLSRFIGTGPTAGITGGVLSKYSKNGDLLFRRLFYSSYGSNAAWRQGGLDADPSSYYLLYADDLRSIGNGTPKRYTFGKVSSSGNGLGNFTYSEGTGYTISYNILSVGDVVGRLSDGSVRQDTSDLLTYPFGANKLLFDDLATQVSNKKRQMDSASSFEYSGGPAIRPADFPTLDLLGHVYSGSGNWLDQSGNNNHGVVNGATWNAAGGYFSFDGSDDYVDVVSNASLSPTSMTLFCFLYTKNLRNEEVICVANPSDGPGQGWRFLSRAFGGTQWQFQPSAGNNAVTGSELSNNRWYCLAVTYQSGGNITLYLNGVQDAQGSATNALVHGTSVRMGTGIGGAQTFLQANVASFQVYNRALTAAEVFQSYNATKSRYINEAPSTAPKISEDNIVYGSNLLLNYDFKNKATYDTAENLISHSEQFGDESWLKINSVGVSTNVTTSPDGTTSADKLVENTDTSHKVLAKSFTLTASTTYTFSIFVKSAERSNILIHLRKSDYSTRFGGFFNLATKTFTGETAAGGTLVSSSIIEYPNNWFRLSITGDIAANTAAVITLYLCDTNNNIGYTADGTSGIYIWGAQLEKGSVARSYIPTGVSAITPTTVKNLSSTSYTGTINGATFNSAGYFDFDGVNDDISVASSFVLSDTQPITIESWVNADTTTNTFQVISTAKATTTHWQLSFTGDPTYNILWAFSGTSNSVGTTTLPSVGAWHHIVATYNGGDKTQLASWKVYVDGSSSTIQLTGSTGAATNETTIGFRTGGAAANRFDGKIGEVRIYNRALTASEVSQNFNATRSKYGV